MKKLLFVTALCLCFVLASHGQVIKNGDVFWDGYTRYVASVIGNDVYLNGKDVEGDLHALKIRKVGKAQGEYQLAKAKADDTPPYGCMFGSKVRYVSSSVAKFLEFYPEEHTVGQLLAYANGSLKSLAEKQRNNLQQREAVDLVSTMVMNQNFLSEISHDIQQLMLEKLKNKKNRTPLENANLDVIAYCNAMGICVDGIGGSGNDASSNVIEVSNEFDFIGSLGSNRTLVLQPGTVINLTEALKQDGFFSYDGRKVADDYHAGRKGSEQLVVACERFDGRQLELINIHDLTIRGTEDCYIVVEPRYANVLNFYKCKNIKIENLTVGHTDEGYCEGGVLFFENCESVRVNNCDLYGCGTYGLETHGVNGLLMENTTIRDCSYGIMELHDTHQCEFSNCKFVRCREFALVNVDGGCEGVRFDSCCWSDNKGMLFNLGSVVKMSGCEIRHSASYDIGNTEMVIMEGISNVIERK